MSSWDVAVIGGGPAGATSAALLAAQGGKVVLFERDARPRHKVCGEFLSHDTLGRLRALGVDLAALDPQPIERVRLAAGAGAASAGLGFAAASIGRRRLDEALRRLAAAHGASIRSGATVLGATEDGEGVRVMVDGGTERAARAVLATGKHELRGHARRGGLGAMAFKQYWRLAPAQARRLEGHVELHLFHGGYAGLQPVAGGRANLCLVANPAAWRAAGGDWAGLLRRIGAESPLFAERLAGGTPCWPRPLAVAAQPYGFVHAGNSGRLRRVGDQLAVIHSFCGAGLGIALHSAAAAAQGPSADPAAPYRRPTMLSERLAAAAMQPAWARLAVGIATAAPPLLRWLALRTRATR